MEMIRCYPSSDLRKWPIISYLDAEFISKIKMVYVFGTTASNAIMVTQEDEVFSMGSNKSGCLGIGNENLTLTPTKVEILCKKSVKGFASGSEGHVIAYTETGAVYNWGYSYYPIAGDKYDDTVLTPSILAPHICGSKVVDSACGCRHVLFLTENGQVFSSGGFFQQHSARERVKFADEANKVTAIACGESSCMAVMENGMLYAWGYNDKGQLGIETTAYQASPCQVTSLKSVVIRKVVCGRYHTMALSDAGILYTWGDNTHGQLGINQDKVSGLTTFTLGPYRVVDIAATHYSNISAAMTENWKVYIWGEIGDQSSKTPLETSFTSLYDAFATYATPRVTWKPIHIDCDAGAAIVESLRSSFDNPSFSDLIIKVKGNPIHVHKCLLKIRCQHFQAMFQKHWKEDTVEELEMNQYSYATYRSFLQYLYTDELDVSFGYVMELLDLAKSYCETQLRNKCEQMVKNGITIENAALLYNTQIQHKVMEQEEFLLEFCKNNVKEVIKSDTFRALDPQKAKDFVCKACK